MTKNLQKILNLFDFCSNTYGKTIVCYVRKGNDNFACSPKSILYKYIQKENINDIMTLRNNFDKSLECMSEPYIINISCGSYYGEYYQHIDPITRKEMLMSIYDINPITEQAEDISYSLTLSLTGNNCPLEEIN